MKTKKYRKFIMFAVVVAMLMQIIGGALYVGAEGDETGRDVTNNLTDLNIKVLQDGTEIPEGGNITSTKPIRVEISFGVPVAGDDPTPSDPVQKGDTVTFDLSSAFKLLSGNTIELKMGTLLVGHATFTTDPITNMVTATVTFDGHDSVFVETSNTVKCEFGANFEYDGSGSSGSAGDHTVTILEKTYTVNVPVLPIEYDVTKTGTVNLADQCITWMININATQGGAAVDLDGYQFFDDLQTVGTYIPSSFKVDETEASPDTADNTLRYVFPGGSTSPKTITFETKISDSAYYATSEQTVSNKAQLLNNESTPVDEGQCEVKFKPKWIEKTGVSSDAGSTGVYNPKDRTITWTITANHNGATLDNVVITDVLPSGLTLKSAKWQAWTGSAWDTATSITPDPSSGSKYAIGNIDSKILLTIVTNVPEDSYTTGTKTYSNSASIHWGGLSGPGLGTGSINVDVGYNAISKSGVADSANQKIRWTVNVDTKGQSIPNLKVYDLLVYGNSINFEAVTGIPSGITSADLTPQYGQKYSGNFIGGTMTVNVIAVEQDGVRVADLLEITGLSTTALNTFSFDSQVVDPNIFAGNKTSTVWNTATLFSANAKLNAATGSVNYTNRMLLKGMLKREAMSDPASGVNSSLTSNALEGFDYKDKSAIFRLNVNADSINLTDATNAMGQTLGTATLTDTLPEGWEFVDIVSGSKYLIFEGTDQSNGTVQAADTIPDTVVGLVASFNGRTATFTFSSLVRPYVILVKARPTSDTAAGYFDSNESTTVRNNVTLNTENWTTGVSSYRDVTIVSQILEKTTSQPTAGELRWTVDYKPYDLAQLGEKLEDQLPVGIDLRTDSSGALLLAGNITANEMTLNSDGSYTIGSPVTLELGTNVSYDNAARVLSFTIPDNTKAYSFSYITDITGEPGTVTNKVSLLGSSTKQEETSKPYVITASDGSASLLRNGWISVTKIDGAGVPLAGAEFTLYAMDGTSVIKKGVTGSEGTIKLKVIPDGEYILRETAAPEGYSSYDREHVVRVEIEGLNVTTSIDGKTGNESNIISIQNFVEGTVGNLEIRKLVEGEAAETDRLFEFTVNFTDENKNIINDSFIYFGNGVSDGTIKTGDRILLGHEQSIEIVGIPKNTNYEVKEEDYSEYNYATVSTGEVGEINADATKTAVFTNTYIIPLINITGTKIWENGALIRPNSISLQLYRNDEIYGQAVYLTKGNVTNESQNVWEYTWTNLPKTDNERKPYTYTVDEVVTPANYIKTIDEDGLTITNTYAVPKTDITANKTWVNGPETRPEIEIQLYRDGQALSDILGDDYGPVKLINGQTSYTWTGLDATDINGRDYVYTVDEVNVPENYEKSVDSLTITNSYVSPKTTFTFNKVWVNGPVTRPAIQVQLYRNSVAFGEPVVLKNGQTSYDWTNLNLNDRYGNPYTYTVDEVAVPENYSKTISEDGLTITNTYVIPKTNITANKIWLGGSAQRPEIELQLYRDGKALSEILGDKYGPVKLINGQTSYTWTGLDATDIDGRLYVYTVDEVNVPEDYVKSINGLTITNSFIEPEEPSTINPILPEIPLVEQPPKNGTVEFDENGKWKYTPNPGFTGEDSFVIRHPDGRLETITVVVEDIPGIGIVVLPKTGEQGGLPIIAGALLVLAVTLFRIRRRLNRQ